MKLVSFSVNNYRSITKAYRLPIRQFTVLIGPNNEGKSNILKGLVTALQILTDLRTYSLIRGRIQRNRKDLGNYDWERDFPVSLQAKYPTGESVFKMEFELTDQEIDEFSTEVKSYLNGTLPIQLSLGKADPGFKVVKKGPGGPALSKKADAIAQFVSKRINITYIPSVRTYDQAEEIVGGIVDRELAVVEQQKAYKDALAEVAKIQAPVLKKISKSITETLRVFLPNVKDVNVMISEEARYRALRRSCEIIVDDGTPTHLARKGDGVQSLAALSLMRHSSESGALGRQLILAIEEPESHLHPSAIHQLRTVLADIASKHQAIMTTHCPLFVDRTSIKSNIIVFKNRAVPANDVKQIRDVLGVRASDNLQQAELVLLVEGEEDKKALTAILRYFSPALNTAIAQRALGIESLLGGSNLSYKVSQVREAMCIAHSFLDHDKTGLDAYKKAEIEGLMSLADVTFATCEGMQESEMEDLYEVKLYSGLLQNKYGVSTMSPKFKGKQKWSSRLRDAFKHQGKPWSDSMQMKVKADIAELVEADPSAALNSHQRSAVDALTEALENKLNAIATSKQ
jgi:putative ATP-dependent endonuclease of the OLD family